MANVKKPREEKDSIKIEEVSTDEKSFFDKLGGKTLYFAIGLVLLIALLVFKDFLLGEKVYLFKDIGSDTLNGNLPYLFQITESLKHLGQLTWSFHNGMGQSLFPLSLRDPFDLMIIAGGTKSLYFLLGFKEFLKVLIGGLLFFLYLKELQLNNYSKIIGTLLFSFCGFMIVGGGWYIFSFEAVNVALLLYGFELLFQKNKGLVFSIGIFLFAVSMPFSLYIYGLFIAVYAFLRYYSTSPSFKLQDIVLVYGKMILFGFIGICLAGPFLLEGINQILSSPRGSGENSYFNQLASMPLFETSSKLEFGTCMMRLFSSDMLGTGNEFKGWQNTLEAPLFYCGISALLLLPQLFVFLTKKQKIAFSAFMSLWFLPIIFPYFRRALWLFSGDYYRSYSFFVSLTLLIFSAMALHYIVKHRKVNLIVLVVTVVVLYLLLMFPYFEDAEIINGGISLFAKLFILINAGLIYMLSKSKNVTTIMFIFLATTCLELLYFSSTSVNGRDIVYASELKEKKGYNDFSNEAVNYIKKNDASFYRIDKNYNSSPAMHYSINDALIQDYYGTSCYNGFSQNSYIKYLKEYGIINPNDEAASRWANGLINRVILESINSVKYLLIKEHKNPIYKAAYDSITQFGDVKVLKNKFILPLGFCYDTYIENSAFKKLSPFQKDFVSLKAFLIEDGVGAKLNGYSAFNLADTLDERSFTFEIYDSLVRKLKTDTLTIESFAQNHIKGKIKSSEAKLLYLSIPNDKAWTIKLNSKQIEPILIASGMMGIPLSAGDNSIELTFKHLYIGKGIVLSLFGFLLLLGSLFYFNKQNKKDIPILQR